MVIPSLLVLKLLENDDKEKCLIEVKCSEYEELFVKKLDIQGKIINEMKGLAMCLSRFKPADWNKFLDVVIK